MRSLKCLNGLVVLVLMSAASFASAQFAVDTPPLPGGTLPAPQVVPELPPPAALPLRPLTVSEFVATFKPLPGKYEVLLIHPKTGCPVKVCFTLPPGCIRNVRYGPQNRVRLQVPSRCRDSLFVLRQSVGARLNRSVSGACERPGERGV